MWRAAADEKELSRQRRTIIVVFQHADVQELAVMVIDVTWVAILLRVQIISQWYATEPLQIIGQICLFDINTLVVVRGEPLNSRPRNLDSVNYRRNIKYSVKLCHVIRTTYHSRHCRQMTLNNDCEHNAVHHTQCTPRIGYSRTAHRTVMPWRTSSTSDNRSVDDRTQSCTCES